MKGSAMNKKRIKTLLLLTFCLLLAFACFPGASEERAYAADELQGEAYGVFDSSDGSLMLFRAPEGTYTNKQTEGTKTYFTGFEKSKSLQYPPWVSKNSLIRSFSVKDGDTIRPVSCMNWFFDCKELTDFSASGLDTSETVSLEGMFSGCSKLNDPDMSGMDTSSVTNMVSMFQDCTSMKVCDLSGFDTSQVQYIGQMFMNCGVEILDISGFDTSKVSSVNTFFGKNSNLSLIKLGPSFTILNKTELKTPIQRVKLSDDVTETSTPILDSLSDYTGEDTGWYRTGGRMVAVYDPEDGSLTFFDDVNNEHLTAGEEGTKVYYTGVLNTGKTYPSWYYKRDGIKKVTVLDEMAPLTCYRWFYGLSRMTECDLSKLDTSKASRMDGMFTGCSSLSSVRLGEKSVFSVNPPNSGWKRVRLPDGTGTSGPEILNLSDYDGSSPGTYKQADSFTCACFDSSDGSLRIFNDSADSFHNGEVIGTKTYYTGVCLSQTPPWGDVKDSIRSVIIEERISPKNVFDWFSNIRQMESLDLSELVIPSSQNGFLENCTSLKKIIINKDENGYGVLRGSGLKGIWKNRATGEECSLSDSKERNPELGSGEWELITSSKLNIDVDGSAAYGNEPGEHVLKIYHTKDGSNFGEPVREERFSGSRHSFSFEDPGYMYPDDMGNPEYYGYSFSIDDTNDISWSLETDSGKRIIHYKVTIRSGDKKPVSGEIKWEGDLEEDRPDHVTVELYRDGTKIDEQRVTAGNDWRYAFMVPAFGSDQSVFKYEVKEQPVSGYRTDYYDHDAVRILTGQLFDPCKKLWFRRDGRWYEASVNYNGGYITIPGDAAVFDFSPEVKGPFIIKDLKHSSLDDRMKGILDSLEATPEGTEAEVDSLLEDRDTEMIRPLSVGNSGILEYIRENSEYINERVSVFSGPYPFFLMPDNSASPAGTFEMSDIVNTGRRLTTEISGKKEWDTDDHPESIELVLERNGTEFKRIEVNSSGGWEYSFGELPVYDGNGDRFNYEVKEVPLKGFLLRKETRKAETEDKAVKVTYRIAEAFPSGSGNLSYAFYVAYSKDGTAYRCNLKTTSRGEVEIVFPAFEFDLNFLSQPLRGLSPTSDESAIKVTKVEIVDSPYEFDGNRYISSADPDIKWETYNKNDEVFEYPDRDRMYRYGKDEAGILDFLTGPGINTIPYSIKQDKATEVLINEYREGGLKIKKTGTGDEPLKGASFRMYYTSNSLSEQKWEKAETSPERVFETGQDGISVIEHVPYGNYILEETAAPAGYKTEEKIWKVVINADGSSEVFDEKGAPVRSEGGYYIIPNEKTRTVIEKTTQGGRLLSGAGLGLYDKAGTEVASWISSSDEPKVIEGLTEGETYTLKEISPPPGYQKAEDISFTVMKGKDTRVTMKDSAFPVPTGVLGAYGMMTLISMVISCLLLVFLRRENI